MFDWTVVKCRTGRLLLTDGPKTPAPAQQVTLGSHDSQQSLDAIFPVVDVQADCLDITSEYKYPQGLYNDLEGHNNFSTTIYSFSILCLEHHYCGDQLAFTYLKVKSAKCLCLIPAVLVLEL